MGSVRRGYVDTRHGQVHYRTVGEGDALLLLHATPRSSRVFGPLLSVLQRSYRVVAPDTLGFGQSDPLPHGATMGTVAESLVDVIDALALRPTAVFGLHTGNKIGAALANGWPERVTKFILCGMTHSIIPDQAEREAAIRAILAANPIAVDELVNADEKLDRIQGAASVAAMYQANYGFDLAGALTSLQVPTLVLELATPAEDHLGRQAQALAKLVPNAISVTLQHSDRDVLERVPEELAAEIIRFVG